MKAKLRKQMQIPDKNIKDIVLKLEEMFRKIME